MEKEILKAEMMELWKENFHDSEEYIRLVFDNYFDPDYVEYEERDGHLASALLAIPYTFGADNNVINSVYLCGLSTKILYRNQGMMTRLMQKTEARMRKKGYPMMFLIPAQEGLERYYNDRGYINGFYRSELRYTSAHDFKREFLKQTECENEAEKMVKIRYFDTLKTEIFDANNPISEEKYQQIVDYIASCETPKRGFILNQNHKQIRVFLQEAVISGGKMCVALTPSGAIAAVLLASGGYDGISVNGVFGDNNAAIKKSLSCLANANPGKSITIFRYGSDHTSGEAIWEPYYSGAMAGSGQVGDVGIIETVCDPDQHSKVYGMVRILDIFEILKFQARYMRNLKYSILAKQEIGGKIVEYRAENGIVERIEKTSEDLRPGEVIMTEKEIAEVLFRRPDGSYIIEEAFGLPCLDGKIFLMLD